MKRISSRDNPFFKTLRQLSSDAGARRDAGVAVLEGVHLGDAYLRSGGAPKQVVVGASALDHPEIVDLLDRLPNPEGLILDDALFAAVSQLAQGVALLMIVDLPAPVPPERLARWSVVLDRIQDPGNVGSILRSAAAAGVPDVYLSRECAGAWSQKVLRAGMGAHFHLSLFEDCDLVRLKEAASIPWIATSPHAGATIHETDLRGDVAWVFGHEGQGVAPALMRDAPTVRIPQPGRGESLNVAASAAICLFEQVRQRETGR
jgi:TrmH family RNA methyltransferase